MELATGDAPTPPPIDAAPRVVRPTFRVGNDMAVLAAYNLVDRIVLLEDGRELPITQFYAAPEDEDPLTAKSELRKDHHVPDHTTAQVFTVDIPGTDVALIVEMSAINEARARDIN